jgi:hypothetical protein
MTAPYCGHNFFAYSILCHFTFSYNYVNTALRTLPAVTMRAAPFAELPLTQPFLCTCLVVMVFSLAHTRA